MTTYRDNLREKPCLTATQTTPPQITLTGERHGNVYVVRIGDHDVLLTHSCLSAFLELLLAGARRGSGYSEQGRMTVSRLRRSLDEAVGPGTGTALIETGCGREYRLTIRGVELTARVVIEPNFFELEGIGVMTAEQARAFRAFGKLPA